MSRARSLRPCASKSLRNIVTLLYIVRSWIHTPRSSGCWARASEDLMKLPRLILADDHTLVAEALRQLFAPHFEVVATVTDGRALLDSATRLKPDVVVVDIAMPLLN